MKRFLLTIIALLIPVFAHAGYYSPTVDEDFSTGTTDVCFHLKLGSHIALSTTACAIGTATIGVSSDTQFDISEPYATNTNVCRYTFDGTGTDPAIDADKPGAYYGSIVEIAAQNFSTGNNGYFRVTTSTTDYIEVTNASCTVEQNKTIGTGTVVYRKYSKAYGDATSQFDVSEPVADTCRFTWDTTGTNPGINLSTFRVGDRVYINGYNFTAANRGYFTLTGVADNYIEVTNASCVAETNKTLGGGSTLLNFGQSGIR